MLGGGLKMRCGPFCGASASQSQAEAAAMTKQEMAELLSCAIASWDGDVMESLPVASL